MKKNLIKKIVLGVAALITTTLTNVSMPVYACSNSDIETIAKNAPQAIITDEDWTDVEVLNCKPLYNFDEEVVAYSVDLKNNSNNKDAYVIVSNDEKDGPILQLGVDSKSPYDKLDDDNNTLIYNGISEYYYCDNSSDEYYDISNDDIIEDEELDILKLQSEEKKESSRESDLAKQMREYLLEEKDPSDFMNFSVANVASVNNQGHILVGVPDYKWTRGCAPTSSAMVLKSVCKSELDDMDSNSLINELADDMNTEPRGGTRRDMINEGINKFLSSHNIDKKARFYTNKPSFSKAMREIDHNRPFVLNVIENTQKLGSYAGQGGFGNHSMACLGYVINSAGSYLVVHDTQCDGNIYCDFNSSAFGTAWDYIFVDR